MLEARIPGTPADPTPLLSQAKVSALTGLSRTTLWRERRAGRFPAPVRLSTRRLGWRRDAVRAWLDARTEGRA